MGDGIFTQLQRLGVSMSQVGRSLGVSGNKVRGEVQGRSPLSAEVAYEAQRYGVNLHKALGGEEGWWNAEYTVQRIREIHAVEPFPSTIRMLVGEGAEEYQRISQKYKAIMGGGLSNPEIVLKALELLDEKLDQKEVDDAIQRHYEDKIKRRLR